MCALLKGLCGSYWMNKNVTETAMLHNGFGWLWVTFGHVLGIVHCIILISGAVIYSIFYIPVRNASSMSQTLGDEVCVRPMGQMEMLARRTGIFLLLYFKMSKKSKFEIWQILHNAKIT